jgi:hypothetical protein
MSSSLESLQESRFVEKVKLLHLHKKDSKIEVFLKLPLEEYITDKRLAVFERHLHNLMCDKLENLMCEDF